MSEITEIKVTMQHVLYTLEQETAHDGPNSRVKGERSLKNPRGHGNHRQNGYPFFHSSVSSWL